MSLDACMLQHVATCCNVLYNTLLGRLKEALLADWRLTVLRKRILMAAFGSGVRCATEPIVS